nr:drebrin-like protein [Quercus suber]
MAALNTSANGPSISASYQKIVNSSAPSGPAASSPTYGQWALFSVQAPLVNAFQPDSSKESVLRVQTTGEGELADLIEDFSDGRIQFAFVKVKDPNTTLPKNALIAWCGEGVPERTKGYFTSHLNVVSKILHGYHVQVTARSERDLTPEIIVRKVQDASGSKYSGGGATPAESSGPPPPVASKPAMPTKSFGAAGGFQALGSRSRQAPAQTGTVDSDGWGNDAPPVTRSQLEKVEAAYKPTKVDMNALQSQREPSRYQAPQQSTNGNPDVVKGGYQPIGKVDIAALRSQSQNQGSAQDDRPTVVKGAYQPVGKVDIAEIRRKAQAAPPSAAPSLQPEPADDERPKSLAERSSAFNQGSGGSGERLTSLPKPQIANRFGSTASNFAGTKAPLPGAFEAKPLAPAAPVGTASRTFADEGGMTPAQQWEAKRRQRGLSGAADTQTTGSAAPPLQSQQSGGWQSGYGGKKWGVQIPTRTGGSGISEQRTGQDEPPPQEEDEEPTGGISSIRDRFKDTAPMGGAAAAPPPPALDISSKPGGGAPRGVPMPGLPTRPSGVPSEQHQEMPPPPPRPIPAEEEEAEEEDDHEPVPQGSPIRIAMPVAREAQPELEKAEPVPPRPIPASSFDDAVDQNREEHLEAEEPIQDHDPARSAGQAAAVSTFGHAEDPRSAGTSGGQEAIAQYDYEKAEDNELELHEGERITNIDMIDEDWWMGQNSRGETGLFPSNYVEVVEGSSVAPAPAAPTAASRPVPPPVAAAAEEEEEEEAASAAHHAAAGGAAAAAGATAVAQYDYEAAEDNELSFPDGATITGVEFPDDDWWFGHYGGKEGLFPAIYVQLNE